jgi:L-malate glycosyltransferase
VISNPSSSGDLFTEVRTGLTEGPAVLVSRRRRAERWLMHLACRFLMLVYGIAMKAAHLIGRRRRPVDGRGYDILLTGSFHSDDWLTAHLRPLALSDRCARIRMVASTPVPRIEKVTPIYPPSWLVRVVGLVPARLAVFFVTGLRKPAHVTGGFHLLVNGLSAALLGRLAGSRAFHFCVGGPAEVENGGLLSESWLFSKMETPDPIVERYLLKAVATFDLVVTMGTRAAGYFRERGVHTTFHRVSGGIDTARFRPSLTPRTTDMIFVGRLVPVKRIDLFLETIKCVRDVLPEIRATIVGDGPLRECLEQQARKLGIDANVVFVGPQRDVEAWIQQARLFVLTSDSEGLSLSLIEAMLCGLPAVVSEVGDLGDLVENGVNGYLVSDRSPQAFASRIVDLLTDSDRWTRFSQAARSSAKRYGLAEASGLWNTILAGADSPRPPRALRGLTR